MCLWQPMPRRKLFTCRLPNLCLSPVSQLSSSTRPLPSQPPTSITHSPDSNNLLLQHARRQERRQEEEWREGGAGRQEDREDKGRPEAQKGEKAQGAEAKGCAQKEGLTFYSNGTKFPPFLFLMFPLFRLQLNNLDLIFLLPPVPVHNDIVFISNE